jgi:excisionase family DNA binding protein
MQALITVPHRLSRRSRSRPIRVSPGCAVHDGGRGFSPLIDAKAAGELLGVPHTWLLAQARAGRIPHHRLGHYVRFNADDLARWLRATRLGPDGEGRRSGMPR